jgi:hypothetical protein
MGPAEMRGPTSVNAKSDSGMRKAGRYDVVGSAALTCNGGGGTEDSGSDDAAVASANRAFRTRNLSGDVGVGVGRG